MLHPLSVLLAGYTLLGAPAVSRQDPPGERDAAAGLWERARAVLVESCLPCHGGAEPRSDLAFTDAARFARGGSRGPVFDPSDPGSSRLLDVIGYEDPELSMPPRGRLAAADALDLERWILAGAPWPPAPEGRLEEVEVAPPARAPGDGDWWAYRPLARPPPPAFDAGDALHPVDAFLRRGREQAGLEPAPRAGDETLLRRACYDLTGLPPTPDQRRMFLAETGALGHERAWGRLLERLLASPHHGEHWGRHWLDLVRYAETNGYERDAVKTNVWRYRDWVIRALNADMPYDRFVVAQLAGDELAPDDPEALLATGYFRLGVWDDEPADPEQARANELADIVDTTAQVFLATTMGCARCHDHKADPITQRDYYALTAWFNNLQGYGGDAFGQHLGGGMVRALPDAPGPGVASPEEHRAELEVLEGELARAAQELGIEPLDRAALAERSVLVADARGAPHDQQTRWRYLAGEPPDGWLRPAFDDAAWSEGPGGFGTAGTPGARVGTRWEGERIQLRAAFRLEAIPDALGLALHHDEDVAVYLNGRRVLAREGHRTDYTELQLGPEARSALVVGRNVLAVACRQTAGGQYVDVGLFAGRVAAAPEDWLRDLRARLDEAGDGARAERVRALLAERDRLEQAPRTSPYAALVASEFGAQAPEQRVHQRGSVHAPGEVVAPDVPAAFRALAPTPALVAPPVGAASSGRRLALARWIVGDGAFLSARVAANRLWQFHFGRGLCPTPGDFGRFGLEPTHPELLDWLAVELIERGWSLKSMHRLLMESEAYRLSSRPSPEALTRDPENQLYARRDPRRLTAEQYRDAVLATSGALNPGLFGPSVFPPLPAEVLETSSQPRHAWGRSSASEAARRSVYVFAKRSLRPPLFEAFDQPDPDLPCPARYPTNVPTQALMTLNGEFVNSAAAALAGRLAGEAGDLTGRVARGLALAFGRAPAADEIERNVHFVERLSAQHGLSTGEGLRLFCLGLYNRNEFLWVD